MSAERKKILDMLAAGKISAEEAEKLLDKITATTTGGDGQDRTAVDPPSGSATLKPRFLRIEVEKPGQDTVNIRVPLSLARTGTRLMAVLPARVNERLAEFGIDPSALAGLSDQDWNQALRAANIDVSKGDGKRVRIFCE